MRIKDCRYRVVCSRSEELLRFANLTTVLRSSRTLEPNTISDHPRLHPLFHIHLYRTTYISSYCFDFHDDSPRSSMYFKHEGGEYTSFFSLASSVLSDGIPRATRSCSLPRKVDFARHSSYSPLFNASLRVPGSLHGVCDSPRIRFICPYASNCFLPASKFAAAIFTDLHTRACLPIEACFLRGATRFIE